MNDTMQRPIFRMLGLIAVCAAVAGYFTGMQSPMNPKMHVAEGGVSVTRPPQTFPDAIPARTYAEMNSAEWGPNAGWTTDLRQLMRPADVPPEDAAPGLPDPSTSGPVIPPGLKRVSLQRWSSNRAFNGAPPTVPHPIDNRSATACVACHMQGAVTKTLRIPRMSHPFMVNCTQCHVAARAPRPVADEPGMDVANRFVGLPAPTGGPRAFDRAPPQIPHSTWMRDNCLSCHGPTGLPGLRTTHPWRQNCQQCHTPSSTLEQAPLPDRPGFLDPLSIEGRANASPK